MVYKISAQCMAHIALWPHVDNACRGFTPCLFSSAQIIRRQVGLTLALGACLCKTLYHAVA